MTDRQAIVATIKHWTEDYKKLKLFGGSLPMADVFDSETCPLCDQHVRCERKYKHKDYCGRCPLKRRGEAEGCVSGKQPYSRAYDAVYQNDKRAFMAARAALIKRLNRALVRMK